MYEYFIILNENFLINVFFKNLFKYVILLYCLRLYLIFEDILLNVNFYLIKVYVILDF